MPLDLTHFRETARSQRGAVVVYRYRHEFNTKLVAEVFTFVVDAAKELLTQLYNIHSSMRVEIIVGVLMEREQTDEDGNTYMQEDVMYFVSKHEMHSLVKLETIFASSASEVETKLEEFLLNSSRWKVKKMETFDVKIGELRLFQNARPTGYLPMPLEGRRGFVNLRTKEPICFQLSVCASMFWKEQQKKNTEMGLSLGNLNRARTWKAYMDKFEWTDIFPNIYQGLKVFEQKNKICVNIFTEHKGEVVLARKSEEFYSTAANLFLIVKRRKGKVYDSHYVAITDIHMFLGKRWPKRKVWFCLRCFCHFQSKNKFQTHSYRCLGPTDYEPHEKLPREDELIEFKKHEMTMPFPYVIFFDFETFSVPVPESERKKGSNTTVEYRYEPASYALCVAAQNGDTFDIKEVEYYDGKDPANHFLRRAFTLGQKYLDLVRKTNNFIQPTAEELLEFEAATECHFCHQEFTNVQKDEEDEVPCASQNNEEDKMDWSGDELSDLELESLPDLQQFDKPVYKCYHHRHTDGKYLFALCRECNLKIRYKYEVICVATERAEP